MLFFEDFYSIFDPKKEDAKMNFRTSNANEIQRSMNNPMKMSQMDGFVQGNKSWTSSWMGRKVG